MPWIIYLCAGGFTFFRGTLLLVFAVIVRLCWTDRWSVRLATCMAIVAIAMIALAAEAIPFWLYGVWVFSWVGWFVANLVNRWRWVMIAGRITALVSAVAAGMAIRYQLPVTLPAGSSPIYVVGDSISAGMSPGSATWPMLLRNQHHQEVFDLSHPGCTIAEAQDRLKIMSLQRGIVVVEIGGNDILNRTAPKKFGRDLEALVGVLQSPSRPVVMF